jgi:hypothetical protein
MRPIEFWNNFYPQSLLSNHVLLKTMAYRFF